MNRNDWKSIIWW